MRRCCVLVALIAGCWFNPKYGNGHLKCEGKSCPSGYHCATDSTCWKNGSNPIVDLSVELPGDGGSDASGATDGLVVDMIGVMRHQGEACGAYDTCDTGHCVDGYCCDSLCANTCQACNVAGSLGICTDTPVGMSPIGARSCNGEAMTTCGRDGKCDGQGNCRDWPAGTVCAPGTCTLSTGDFTNPSTCNGSGSCVANSGGNCAPYKCQDATQCFSSCSDNTACSGSNMCVNTSCGKLPNGRSCGTNGAQCMTGNCVDGYCCDSPCSDPCQACNVGGSFGTCTTIAKGAPVGTRTCTNLGMSPCGGSCDGNTSTCTYADNTTACGTTCSSVTQLQNSFCDSAGHCNGATPTTCANNFICTGSACLTSCMNNSQCAPINYGCNASGACKSYCVIDTDTLDDGCLVQ